jgi:hypothetical protein
MIDTIARRIPAFGMRASLHFDLADDARLILRHVTVKVLQMSKV